VLLVEAGRGLVEQDQRWGAYERGGESDAPSHTAGKRTNRALERRQEPVGKRHGRRELIRPAHAHSPESGEEGDDLSDRHRLGQGDELRQIADQPSASC